MAPSGIDLIFPNKARVFDFTGSLGFDRHLPSGLLETDPNASFSGDKFVPVTKFQLKTDGFIYTAFRLDGERERKRGGNPIHTSQDTRLATPSVLIYRRKNGTGYRSQVVITTKKKAEATYLGNLKQPTIV
jgi:hypothetical protein